MKTAHILSGVLFVSVAAFFAYDEGAIPYLCVLLGAMGGLLVGRGVS